MSATRQPINGIATQSKLSVTNGAAVSLTIPTSGSGATLRNMTPEHAIINVQSGDIRYTVDGTTPVTGAPGTGIGILVPAGSTISWMDSEFDYKSWITNFKCIASTASNAVLDIAFFD